MPQLELDRPAYPETELPVFRVSGRIRYLIPELAARWIGLSRRGIVVPPMSTQWLQQHNDRAKKLNPR